ncbi:MAG: hydroxymethylbilane synthase [Rickettsiaceae bacterium]|nr:hydroxymethylbilane synthase [Rickettsiaceae bacterium]
MSSLNIKIGTRSSPLALKQTELFINHLRENIEFSYEIIPIKTTGDKILTKPLYEIGGKALFLKELELALISREIDVAIHSLKDVPGTISDQFCLPFFIGGEYPSDIFISSKIPSFHDLPKGSKIGTCSPRRISIIKKLMPNIEIVPIRGNIGSRLGLLDTNQVDAIVLAEAGLRRLGLYDSKICKTLSNDDFIPSPGQGIIAAQTLRNNDSLNRMLAKFSNKDIDHRVLVEREFLESLSADCDSPVAAFVEKIEDNSFTGRFMYGESLNSNPAFLKRIFYASERGIGRRIAEEIKLF